MTITLNELQNGLTQESDAVFVGTYDDDNLYGSLGNDVFIGGSGNDKLFGRKGSDTYIFSKGDGHDIIDDSGAKTDIDTVRFTDVSVHEVSLHLEGNSLILKYGPEDSVEIKSFSKNQAYSSTWIEKFVFADQTLTLPELLASKTIFGTDGNDSFYAFTNTELVGDITFDGGAGNDVINMQATTESVSIMGGEGKDNLYGGSNDDSLNGGADDDYIIGNDGNDTIISGTGNDELVGGKGSDTYVFSKGDGHDIIRDSGAKTDIDTVKFTDVAAHEVSLEFINTSLILKYGPEDSIEIKEFNKSQAYSSTWIEKFEFADKTLTLSELLAQGTETTSDIVPSLNEHTDVNPIMYLLSISSENQEGLQANDSFLNKAHNDLDIAQLLQPLNQQSGIINLEDEIGLKAESSLEINLDKQLNTSDTPNSLLLPEFNSLHNPIDELLHQSTI